MKKFKKTLVWILTFSILIQTVLSLTLMNSLAESSLIVYDQFNDLKPELWEYKDSDNVFDGFYHAGAFTYNRLIYSSMPNNISAETKLSFVPQYDVNGKMESGFAGLAVRCNDNNCDGYRLCIGTVNGSDKPALKLSKVVYGSETIIKKTFLNAEFGDTHILKITVYDDNIVCYINDAQLWNIKDSSISGGTVALYTGCASAFYDYIKVENAANISIINKSYDNFSFDTTTSKTIDSSIGLDTFELNAKLSFSGINPSGASSELGDNTVIDDWDDLISGDDVYLPVYISTVKLTLNSNYSFNLKIDANNGVYASVTENSNETTPIYIGNISNTFVLKCSSVNNGVDFIVNNSIVSSSNKFELNSLKFSSNNAKGKLYDINLQNHSDSDDVSKYLSDSSVEENSIGKELMNREIASYSYGPKLSNQIAFSGYKFSSSNEFSGIDNSDGLLSNGKLVLTSTSGFRYFTPAFSKTRNIKAAAVDIKVLDSSYAGMMIIKSDLSYGIRLFRNNSNIYVQVIEYLGGESTVIKSQQVSVTNCDAIQHLMFLVDSEKVYIYLNGSSVTNFAPEHLVVFNDSDTFTLYTVSGTCEFDDLWISGSANYIDSDFIDQIGEYKPISKYADNFDCETGYWASDDINNTWEISNNNLSCSAQKPSCAYLSSFGIDNEISADVKVNEIKTTGAFALFTRYSVSQSGIYAGYDFSSSNWFVKSSAGTDFKTEMFTSDSTNLTVGKTYKLTLRTVFNRVLLTVDGETILDANTSYVGYGKCGLYSDSSSCSFDNVVSYNPSGESFVKIIANMNIFGNDYITYSEIEELPSGKIALFSGANYKKLWDTASYSLKNGSSSYYLPDGATSAGYLSVLKLQNGNYISIGSSSGNLKVCKSSDFKNWNEVGLLLPSAECSDTFGNKTAIVHVSSFSEIQLPNGQNRIFIPITVRKYSNAGTLIGHYTRIFYSDDSGNNWVESSNNTDNITAKYTSDNGYSFCESKVILCNDGSLRMYCTRDWSNCVYYAESVDNGVTWRYGGTVDDMPCSVSSHGIYFDKETNEYYMAYVKNEVYANASIFPRTQLVLAKSIDGKSWNQVCVLDRFINHSAIGSQSCYQILDPCVFVSKDSIYVSYGRSDEFSADSSHNAQKARFICIHKVSNQNISFSPIKVSQKINDYTNNIDGIRYTARINYPTSKTYKDEFVIDGETYNVESFGMLVIPTELLRGYELNSENSSLLGGKYVEAYSKGNIFAQGKGYTEFTALFPLNTQKYDEFSLRPILRLVSKNGNKKEIYGNVIATSLSVFGG